MKNRFSSKIDYRRSNDWSLNYMLQLTEHHYEHHSVHLNDLLRHPGKCQMSLGGQAEALNTCSHPNITLVPLLVSYLLMRAKFSTCFMVNTAELLSSSQCCSVASCTSFLRATVASGYSSRLLRSQNATRKVL